MNHIPPDELMPAPIHKRLPARTLIPLMPGSDNRSLLKLAHWLAVSEPVLLMGLVPVPEGENLSAGTEPARKLRDLIQKHIDRVRLRAKPRIRVSYTPWDEIRVTVARESSIKLLVLNWPHQLEALRLTPAEILSHPPCDVAIVRGPFPEEPASYLIPNRGGPHAERALSLGLTLARHNQSDVVSLRLIHPEEQCQQGKQEAFAGMEQVLAEMPEVIQRTEVTDDPAKVILDISRDFDVVALGTAAYPTESTTSFGEWTDHLLQHAPAAIIAVKTRRVVPEQAGAGRFGAGAISILVDKWFAENTFHADEFADLKRLMALKAERGATISLALPALNEEKTVGDVIRTAQRALMEQVPLLDEIVLIDSNSTDRTREIAADLGIPVYIHQEILPRYGARDGKGEALWKSLYVTEGDVIIWVDTDIRNFHPRFVYGLVGPLLYRTKLMFVKGFYRRPLRAGKELKPGRGGRVTELTARPLLNLFYPQLSGIAQPLSGEYGGRREVLEQLTFTSGYGVETSLLIDVVEQFKLGAIAQVDLVERIHRNHPLTKLSKMSFAIIQTLFSKLERRHGQEMLEDVNRTMKIVKQEKGRLYLNVEEIAELERPPMLEIPEYRCKRGYPELEPDDDTTSNSPRPD